MAAPKGMKKKASSTSEKSYTFTFTVPELIGLCAGGVGALCAFFVLGILLGRGYQPEKDVPELAMMMPSQSVNGSGEVKGGVLKPEELQYIDAIKKKPESAVKPEQPKKAAAPAKAEKAAEPAVKKTGPVKAEQEAAPAVVKADSEPEVVVEIDNPSAQVGPVYNYLYQAASFGSTDKADEFTAQLAARGLDAYSEPGKSGSRIWYRVYVRHTGTPESTQDMKKVLREFGIKKPMLKSKKAVQ